MSDEQNDIQTGQATGQVQEPVTQSEGSDEGQEQKPVDPEQDQVDAQ